MSVLISGTTGRWRNTFRIFESAVFRSELFRVVFIFLLHSISLTHTRTHSVTPPLYKSACHGGDIACMQSQFIKRMALFYFIFSPSLPISPGYLISLSWQLLHTACLCQAPCISEVLFSSLSATDNDKRKHLSSAPGHNCEIYHR